MRFGDDPNAGLDMRDGRDGIPRRFQAGFGSTFGFWLGLEFGHEFDNYSERFSLVLGVF